MLPHFMLTKNLRYFFQGRLDVAEAEEESGGAEVIGHPGEDKGTG